MQERDESIYISIHAPPRGATGDSSINLFDFGISIHAPPRGATGLPHYVGRAGHISIHAPPRGATRRMKSQKWTSRNFNSRPSARGDPRYSAGGNGNLLFQFTPLREGRQRQRWLDYQADDISIHAPPRGATISASESSVHGYLFQFTPLREGRP